MISPRRHHALRLVLLLSVAGSASGEPLLTWNDLVKLASQRHPELLSAVRSREARQAEYRGSYNRIFPQVNFQNSYTKRSSTKNNATIVGTGGQTGTVTTASESWQAQGTANLDVIDVGQWAGIRSAKAAYRRSDADLRVTSSQVLLDLYQAFSATLYAQESTDVSRRIQALWKTNSEMIGLRYNSGRESKGNKLRTDAELLQANTEVNQAERDLRVAQQRLGQAIGSDRYEAYAVTGTWTSGGLPAQIPELDPIIAQEPRVQAQLAALDAAKATVMTAQSSFFPTLSLSYSRGFQGQKEFPTDNPFWNFSGVLSYPLFAGGPTASYYNNRAANRAMQAAEKNLRSIQHQVRTELETAWTGYAQALDQVMVQQAFLEAARQRRKESDVRYQNGLMTFENWQLIVTEQVNFERSFLRSQQNLLLAEAQWRFASGQQLGAFL